MSKDKKNEGKEILEELKGLSEWQKQGPRISKRGWRKRGSLAERRKGKDKLEWEKDLKSEDKRDQEDEESAKESLKK